MKGMVLAGGKGTRLYPLTKIINKNLLAVYDKPLIYYPILTLRDAGIKDILIVSGKGHAGQFLDLLGAGKGLGVNLSYELQDEPKGIAHGLGLARDFADDGSIAMILGDNVFEDNLQQVVKDFEQKGETGGVIAVKPVIDPQRFGIVEINEKSGRIISIEEKPINPKSNLASVGFYIYDNSVFDRIKKLKPSARGELEITDVNLSYLQENKLLYHRINGEWIDAGTFDSLLRANNFMATRGKFLFNI